MASTLRRSHAPAGLADFASLARQYGEVATVSMSITALSPLRFALDKFRTPPFLVVSHVSAPVDQLLKHLNQDSDKAGLVHSNKVWRGP
jgi:hypothetical protein